MKKITILMDAYKSSNILENIKKEMSINPPMYCACSCLVEQWCVKLPTSQLLSVPYETVDNGANKVFCIDIWYIYMLHAVKVRV